MTILVNELGRTYCAVMSVQFTLQTRVLPSICSIATCYISYRKPHFIKMVTICVDVVEKSYGCNKMRILMQQFYFASSGYGLVLTIISSL